MDEAIVNHIKKEYKLLIGQQTAEEIKLEVGSAFHQKEEMSAEVRGRDLISGLPKTVVLTSEEIRTALDNPVAQIIDAIKSTLDKTPPELAADIMDRGIVLAGGGALLTGLDERLRHWTLHAGPSGREPAHLRGCRLGQEPGGVRGDPPLGSCPPQQSPALAPQPANLWRSSCLATEPPDWRCWAVPSSVLPRRILRPAARPGAA